MYGEAGQNRSELLAASGLARPLRRSGGRGGAHSGPRPWRAPGLTTDRAWCAAARRRAGLSVSAATVLRTKDRRSCRRGRAVLVVAVGVMWLTAVRRRNCCSTGCMSPPMRAERLRTPDPRRRMHPAPSDQETSRACSGADADTMVDCGATPRLGGSCRWPNDPTMFHRAASAREAGRDRDAEFSTS